MIEFILAPLRYVLWFLFSWVASISGHLSLATLLFAFVAQAALYVVRRNRALHKAYDTNWALVTGASSGIGRSISEKLARQGCNIVLVALDDSKPKRNGDPGDDLLNKFHAELTKQYPDLQFKKVPCDLSSENFMEDIETATKNIDIGLVFNNAGYMFTSFFAAASIERNLANYDCNATACVKITHHFLNKMHDAGRRGMISFTSSSAGFIPGPMSAMYASTKAFLTMFAQSIAPEVKSYGIDIIAVHPSPMATNFFKGNEKLGALMAFKGLAAGPAVIAEVIWANAGLFTVCDQGIVSLVFRIILKFLDMTCLVEIITRAAHTSDDFKTFAKEWSKKSK